MSQRELRKHTTRAMKLEESSVPEAVFLPPAIRGKLVKAVYKTSGTPTQVSEHVVRINDETDPVGLLIAIANGQPVPTFTINKEGETIVKYETLDLKDRIPVIKFLSDKVLPRMSVFKKLPDAGGGDAGWLATLSNAAEQESADD